MAGNTASNNIEGFIYTAMNAIYQTSLSFTSQNIGAKKYNRIDKILIQCLLVVSAVGLVLGCGLSVWGRTIVALYNKRGCYSIWAFTYEYHMYVLSVLRHYGCICRQYTRTWVFDHANVSIAERSLFISRDLDLYNLSNGSNITHTVYFLSDFMDFNSQYSFHLLSCHTKKSTFCTDAVTGRMYNHIERRMFI